MSLCFVQRRDAPRGTVERALMSFEPFSNPMYLDRWVLLPSGSIELLRVEKVRLPDGSVRYYHPARPSFIHPDAMEFAPEEVAGSKSALEALRTVRSGHGEEERLPGYDWPVDI